MADGVTYADLKFDATLEHDTEAEDVMYENVDGLQPPIEKKERGPLPAPTPEKHGQLMTRLHKWALHLCLVSVLLCLTLLSGVIFLAVKYAETSRDLQHSVTSYRTMRSSLTQRLHSREDELDSVMKELLDTRTELEQTVQDNMGLNSSLLRSQQDTQNCTTTRQAAEGKLDQWEKGLCPEGWLLFGKKCLWFSKDRETWYTSKESCESQNSNLLVVPWDDKALQDFVSEKQDDSWVGKESYWKNWELEWKWPQGYPNQYYYLWKISRGALQRDDDHRKNRWICEKNIALTSLVLHNTRRLPGITLHNVEHHCYRTPKFAN